jgi:phospholipid/cholesterol/gamma-HCH transport system permease protein
MFAATSRLAQGYASMLVHAFLHRSMLANPEVRDALWRQIHFTGVRALPYSAVMAALFGALVVTRLTTLVGDDNEGVLKAIISGGLAELGPLLTAFIVIVRSSVAIAAEVALMGLRSQVHHSLWSDAITEDEVVLPRVLGVAIGAMLSVMCFEVMAMAAAIITSALSLGTTIGSELNDFLLASVWWQVPLSLAKGALFGAGIAVISCYHGLQAGRAAGDVPKAVVAACGGSLTYVIVVDALALVLRFV